jgi:hypothetical protein
MPVIRLQHHRHDTQRPLVQGHYLPSDLKVRLFLARSPTPPINIQKHWPQQAIEFGITRDIVQR